MGNTSAYSSITALPRTERGRTISRQPREELRIAIVPLRTNMEPALKCTRIFETFILTMYEILQGIVRAARNGRTLPRLTLVLPIQAALHCGNATKTESSWYRASLFLLCINIILNMAGYSFLVLLYRHSIQVIFNRKVTTYKHVDVPRPHPAIESFNTHLLMLRPLEIIFRFLTAPLRVLPDVIVLGEVRCGTTNLCAHITSLSELGSKVKCYPPFCPWVHPELDNKESFYFVGHYLGIVDPYLYRMAFPLIVSPVNISLFVNLICRMTNATSC